MGLLNANGRYGPGDGEIPLKFRYDKAAFSPLCHFKGPKGRTKTMTMYNTIDDLGDLRGKRALVRVDFNVPMQDGKISDATRLAAAVPTVRLLHEKGAATILLAHFGRPKGEPKPDMSLEQVAQAFANEAQLPVGFVDATVGEKVREVVSELQDGDVILLENTRFHAEEEDNGTGFAGDLASLGDVYVNDAFSAAHRALG